MSLLVKHTELENKLVKLFCKYGASPEDAKITVNCLMVAEMSGISSHGLKMVSAHLKKCQSGYNLKAEMKKVRETAAFTVFDAENAIGMVSAWKCIEYAVKKSEDSGIYSVFCNNANTFSAAYCYAKYAVEHQKIAFISCNSPAQMAPLGGKDKLLGTNPLAIGIPALTSSPFILDMATSAVAKSKINMAIKKGETKIPFGWATDINGVPTDDPKAAVAGLILPMAGPKGYGLAMAIDVISGLLCHASYLDNVGRFYSKDNQCMNVGHTFVVMDPIMIYGDEFFSQMDEYLEKVRNSAPGSSSNIMIPGDINANCYKECCEKGVFIDDELENELNFLFKEIGENI